MTTRFKPTGLDNVSNPLQDTPAHEILEKHLVDNWNDDVIAKTQIKFSYKMRQNVSATAKNSLKCFDGGTDSMTLELNDSLSRDLVRVNIELEARHINNFVDDTPPDLFTIRNVIRDIINADRLALQSKGIHAMTFVGNGEVKQDEANTYIYKMRVLVRCLVLYEQVS